jgi:hypothetical protein
MSLKYLLLTEINLKIERRIVVSRDWSKELLLEGYRVSV